jgi:HK97 family phage major capsid protein
LKLIIEDQLVRPRARVVPMATNTLWWPKIVDTTHATTIHGGMKATATAEAASLGTGDPAVGQMQLIAKKYTSSWRVSNELIMDSPISIMPLLGELGREAVGFDEDYDAITGNGAGKLFGFLNSGALISNTRKVTGSLVWDDVTGLYSKMFPSSYKRGVFACSPGVLPTLFSMVVPAGTGGSAVFVSNVAGQTAADAPRMTILGQPLIVSEKLPALGTVGDLVFCDFSYYIIGDRQDLRVDASEHVYFANDQTAVRMIERLDGQPWLDSPLTARNGTDTLSAFVAVAT